MGPAPGPGPGQAELLVRRTFTSPYFAAMANAAASHVAEQDDVHNGSVFHPATVVFPVALARCGLPAALDRQSDGVHHRRPGPARTRG
jgi:2-methylcitrate dehydratase PrpD